MATESNTGFRREGSFGSSMSQHAISFQSGAINSSSNDMIQMANYYGVNNNNTGMMFSGNSNIMSNNQLIPQAGSTLLVESVPGLKNETGLNVEWSVEEQYKLEEGLKKHEDEPSIMKYVKIAAMLRDKTVRDVALRCRWMTRKRRKQEDHSFLKKVKDRKDKLVESSLKTNISLPSPFNLAPYSLFTNHLDNSERIPIEALSGPTRHLLDQNKQVLDQISANLSMLKLPENVDLFLRTRNNLAAVLNDMRDMPSIMNQMPPLPVTINEDLANSLLPSSSQSMLFGSSSGIHLKQEPGC